MCKWSLVAELVVRALEAIYLVMQILQQGAGW